MNQIITAGNDNKNTSFDTPAVLTHKKNIQGQTTVWTAAHIQLFSLVFSTVSNTRDAATAKSSDHVYLKLHGLEVDFFSRPNSAFNQQEWQIT